MTYKLYKGSYLTYWT